MQSERRCIHILLKHLSWSLFLQTGNDLKSLTGHVKHSILDVWRGSDGYASPEKQGMCKVSKTLDALSKM